MGVLTVETDVERLMRDNRYKISGYMIDDNTIMLMATELNVFQDEIPKMMHGRNVQIFKSI